MGGKATRRKQRKTRGNTGETGRDERDERAACCKVNRSVYEMTGDDIRDGEGQGGGGRRGVAYGKLLLVLNVELGDGKTGSIEVRHGHNLRELALDFCAEHRLDVDKVVGPLQKHLQSNVFDILRTRQPAAAASIQSERSSSISPEAENNSHSEPLVSHDYPGSTMDDSTVDDKVAMDDKVARAFRKDLDEMRERRMKEIQVAVAQRTIPNGPKSLPSRQQRPSSARVRALQLSGLCLQRTRLF